ncbi:hypothetical protein K2X33_02325 [bacterium]|nr:hypothetical protein [bacterium]
MMRSVLLLPVWLMLSSCGTGLIPDYLAQGCPDLDNDGYCGAADCDDRHASAHPGGTEICDGLDNDCNGASDDSCTPSSPEFSASVLGVDFDRYAVTGLNFAEAINFCAANGGIIPYLEDNTMNTAFSTLCNEKDCPIGLRLENGVWTDALGSPQAYFDWAAGQPGAGICVYRPTGSQWATVDCEHSTDTVICRFD